MNKTHGHPAGNQRRLPVDDGIEKCQIDIRVLVGAIPQLRVVPVNGVIRQSLQSIFAQCGREFEGAHTNVARGNAG